MVKICNLTYPSDKETEYKKYYDQYSYDLHDFQKWTVEAITSRNHVLICAPTGSGKTFGGDFAISFFHQLGKKTIYTCPIKALSNEKYYQFSKKYPDIQFGLITGDIRCNPDADVLIMTTEILLNKLFQIKNQSVDETKTHQTRNTSFEMDIPNELGCVVFDEIHMIGDESRGTVWENTLMMLEPHIQVVGLSATLSYPERFASWIENRHITKDLLTSKSNQKTVYLTKQTVRAVPLTHYFFITVPKSLFKIVKDKTVQEEIKKLINKPLLLQNSVGLFHETNMLAVRKALALFHKSKIRVKRGHVLNQLCTHMAQEDMFPALCYVFSRKQLEICAHEVTTNLLEFDSKIPYTVDRECEQLLRERLLNFDEYLHLPEYVNLVGLLRKGIAIHHAGMMPVLKEMVELLFSKGFVKLLFCTETMSVGINLPVKTTIFTDVSKFSDSGHRLLHSYEMTQAAGRAGRLGQDAVGNVIHLNNLFSSTDPLSSDYKNMLSGVPQKLVSKFRVSYSLVLQNVLSPDTLLENYASKSMIMTELNKELKACQTCLALQEYKPLISEPLISEPLIDEAVILRYIECCDQVVKSTNKKRKELDRELLSIRTEYTVQSLNMAVFTYKEKLERQNEIKKMKTHINYIDTYIQCKIKLVNDLLMERGFINQQIMDPVVLPLTGQVALRLNEVPCLPFSEFINNQQFKYKSTFTHLTATDTIQILSCVTSVRVPNDQKQIHVPSNMPDIVKDVIFNLKTLYDEYEEIEGQRYIQSGEEYNMQYDLMPFMQAWTLAINMEECKVVLQQLKENSIFLGEFVKALLKINNIASELEGVAELMGNLEWLSVLKEIPKLTLKFIVTNQSLYV